MWPVGRGSAPTQIKSGSWDGLEDGEQGVSSYNAAQYSAYVLQRLESGVGERPPWEGFCDGRRFCQGALSCSS